MIEYIEIVNRIKDVKEESIEDFNKYVSIPMILSNQESLIKKDGENILIIKDEKVCILNKAVRQAFSEIISLLKKIDKDLYNKIEYKYIDYFEKFKDVEYSVEFKEDEKLDKLELNDVTLEILTIFNLKFWCVDDEDRKEFLKNLNKKEIIENREKEDNEIEDENIEMASSEAQMIKNTWWMNLLNKLRKLKKGNK